MLPYKTVYSYVMTNYTPLLLLLFLLLPSTAEAQSNGAYTASDLPQQWQNDTLFRTRIDDNVSWWSKLDDPLLDSLVQVSLANNQNLLAATQRIAMARAAVTEQRAAYYPTLDLDVGWSRDRYSRHTERATIPEVLEQYSSIGLSTSWEIDIFGAIRNKVKARKGEYRASKEEFDAVRLSLIAAVATAYTELRTLQQQHLVATQNSLAQKEVLHITEVRFDTGLSSQLDVLQAKSVYYATLATLPAITASIDNQINSLATLLALFPDALKARLAIAAPIPNYSQIVGVGIPADLLRRRPDVRQAEEVIASYAALVGVAKSAFLPTFVIDGSVGFAAFHINELFDKNSLTYEIAPTLSWRLFEGVERIAANRSARAQLEEGVRQYNQTLLTAVQEVDSYLSAYTNALRQIEAWQMVVNEGEETLSLSLSLYKQGLISFEQVQDAQRSVLSYQNSHVQAKGSALSALIQLYKALGGSWL